MNHPIAVRQMAFNHGIFVASFMNIDYLHDYNYVICYSKFLSKHCYTCLPPEEGLKSAQPLKFSF